MTCCVACSLSLRIACCVASLRVAYRIAYRIACALVNALQPEPVTRSTRVSYLLPPHLRACVRVRVRVLWVCEWRACVCEISVNTV